MSDEKKQWVFWAMYTDGWSTRTETPRFATAAERDEFLKSVGCQVFTCYRKMVGAKEFVETVQGVKV